MKKQAKKPQDAQEEKKLQKPPEADLARTDVESEADDDKQDRGRITSITIENFKGISEAVKIPICPITLLFGKNSSGKSTVLQALRYHYFIRHTELESKIRYKSSSQIDMVGGHNIDLADFSSLVHLGERNRKIRVRITYAPKEEDEKISILWEEVITSWRENKDPKKPKLEKTHVESILLGCEIDNEEMCFISSGEKPDKTVVGSNGEELDPINLTGDITLEQAIITSDITLEQALLLREIGDDFIQTGIGKEIKEPKKLDAIRHLGPFREVPSDDDNTPQKKKTDESRWEKGAGAWEALAQDSELLRETNKCMKEDLELRYSINQPQSQFTKLLHYKNNDEDNGIDVGLSDVGIGISQLIPVVVGALDNSQNYGIFAVEQPELHIHPALQVALGDVFIDAIKDNNRTILIETHSEHLLLRLLRRVRETTESEQTESEQNDYKLKPDDLSILYIRVPPTPKSEVSEESKVSEFIPLGVMDDGDFDGPWPKGFFDERLEELL